MGAAAALFALLIAAVIDEEPPHRLRPEREPMGPPLPLDTAIVLEAKPRLVNERRRLQRVILPLASQIAACYAAQFAVDHRKELAGRRRAFRLHRYLKRERSLRASSNGCRFESPARHSTRKLS
jgi:hypothetical protein